MEEKMTTVSQEELDHLIKIATRKIKRMTLSDVLECTVENTEKIVAICTFLTTETETAFVMNLDKKDRDLIEQSIIELISNTYIKVAVKNLRNFDIRITNSIKEENVEK